MELNNVLLDKSCSPVSYHYKRSGDVGRYSDNYLGMVARTIRDYIERSSRLGEVISTANVVDYCSYRDINPSATLIALDRLLYHGVVRRHLRLEW